MPPGLVVQPRLTSSSSSTKFTNTSVHTTTISRRLYTSFLWHWSRFAGAPAARPRQSFFIFFSALPLHIKGRRSGLLVKVLLACFARSSCFRAKDGTTFFALFLLDLNKHLKNNLREGWGRLVSSFKVFRSFCSGIP